MDKLFQALSGKIFEKYQTDISEHFQEFDDLSGYVATQFSRKDPVPSYADYQKEVLKQGWDHFEKKIQDKGQNTNIMGFVDSYDQYRGDQTNALKGMYQHTGYGRERQEMMSLVIDSDNQGHVGVAALAAGTTTFSIDLSEPLVIDKLSNVYLDNITTYGLALKDSATASNMCILLKIDQFNINTKGTGRTSGTPSATTNHLNDRIVIPNSSIDIAKVYTHKGNKFNYVAQINPQKITKISGSITGVGEGSNSVDTTTAPGTIFTTNARFIIEFLIVAVDKMSWK